MRHLETVGEEEDNIPVEEEEITEEQDPRTEISQATEPQGTSMTTATTSGNMTATTTTGRRFPIIMTTTMSKTRAVTQGTNITDQTTSTGGAHTRANTETTKTKGKGTDGNTGTS